MGVVEWILDATFFALIGWVACEIRYTPKIAWYRAQHEVLARRIEQLTDGRERPSPLKETPNG